MQGGKLIVFQSKQEIFSLSYLSPTGINMRGRRATIVMVADVEGDIRLGKFYQGQGAEMGGYDIYW